MEINYPELTLLGSTGSIGTQALELASAKNIKVNTLCARSSVGTVEAQARKFQPSYCVMTDVDAAKDLKARLADTGVKLLSGD